MVDQGAVWKDNNCLYCSSLGCRQILTRRSHDSSSHVPEQHLCSLHPVLTCPIIWSQHSIHCPCPLLTAVPSTFLLDLSLQVTKATHCWCLKKEVQGWEDRGGRRPTAEGIFCSHCQGCGRNDTCSDTHGWRSGCKDELCILDCQPKAF